MKAKFNFWQIISMNIGFLGIQYSFGLQQTNMTPIYSYLGANPEQIPLLNLAGPMTGLIVQPIVGAMSDKTVSRFGRRRPYFVVGAVLCSLCLFLMPHSSSLWMAAGLLWILDAANNITMEPYRAFVSDILPEKQHPVGFLTQSFFTGLGITLANLTPSLLIMLGIFGQTARTANNIPYATLAAFSIGAVVSIASVMYSVISTPEPALTPEQITEIQAQPKGIVFVFKDIVEAIRTMPKVMRQLGVVYLFNWYAMFIYWQFVTLCLASSIFHTSDPNSTEFVQAELLTGQINGTYNVVTFCVAFLLAWFTSKMQARYVHSISLLLAAAGLMTLPFITDKIWLIVPMIGFGIGWASMMGTPYVMLAGNIPPAQTGIYMGILNMFIVLPMMLQTLTFRWIYQTLLHSNAQHAIVFAGVLILIAATLTLFIKKNHQTS